VLARSYNILREGARKLLAQAVESEITNLLDNNRSLTTENRWRRLKGYKLLADVIQGLNFLRHTPDFTITPDRVASPLIPFNKNTTSFSKSVIILIAIF